MVYIKRAIESQGRKRNGGGGEMDIETKITLGDRVFACAAPKLWNNLPFEVRKSPSVNILNQN